MVLVIFTRIDIDLFSFLQNFHRRWFTFLGTFVSAEAS